MKRETEKKLLELVKNNYAEIAESFNQTRKRPVWPELSRLAERIPSGARVLDAGCGNGRLLEVFKDRKIEYLGVDFSPELIEKARQNYPQAKFLTADILDLGSLEEVDFDWVFSVAVLHHLPGKDLRVRALKQMRNKIKKDGEIIVTVWNLGAQKWARRLRLKFWILKIFGKHQMDFGDILFDWKGEKSEKASRRYYHVFKRKELKKIAKEAGLEIKKFYKDRHNYYLLLGK